MFITYGNLTISGNKAYDNEFGDIENSLNANLCRN